MRTLLVSIMLVLSSCLLPAVATAAEPTEYRVLATNKTSTMQKEMMQAAEAGFRYSGVMGGETSFGGSEVLVVMSRKASEAKPRYEYRLLATSKTSTMQKELQEAGDAGFEYRGQTVFKSMFGGKEVVVILERDTQAPKAEQAEYRLLATKRTSTMQKELQEAGDAGFEFVGLTVGETLMGGTEVVCIMKRTVR
jgi:3-methyladenine DNA glycosylase Tag